MFGGLCLGLLFAGLPSQASAHDVTCPAGDVACLIEAINTANLNPTEAITIALEAGTYTLTTPVDNTTDDSLPPVTSTLTIRGAEDGTTILERVGSAPFFRLVQVAASGNLTLDRLILRGGDGGGLLNNGGTVVITNTTFARNAALAGGGLANGVPSPEAPHGTVVITNTTFAHNFANEAGGIHNIGGTLILTNTTLARNASENGSGISNDLPGSAGLGSVVLLNTILALNRAFRRGPDCIGPVISLGTNLVGDPTGCTIILHASDRTGDPGVGDFTDDGTPGHGHFPLLEGSPAIDAGNDAVCPRTDQLGQPRVGVCDIGAIEFQGKKY